MEAVKAGRWRRLWLNVHLWIGVGLLLALAPLGLSGSALVWDTQLDRVLSPGHYVAATDTARLGPSAYLAAGQAALGERARASQVRWPQHPGDAVVVSGRQAGPSAPGRSPGALNAWLDPATGRALDVGDPRASLVGVTHRLHGNLLLPANGRAVVGWLGWAMAASCLTGLWLWWPKGRWLAGLGWRRGPHAWSDLHHMAGFWICLPLFVLSITGVYIAFPKASHALVGAPPPVQGSGARIVGDEPPAGSPRMTADAAVAAATAQSPGARLVALTAPAGGRHSTWRVQVRLGEAPAAVLAVDDVDGRVRRAGDDGSHREGPDPVSRLMRGLHDGDDTPAPWRWIITAAGAAPTLLGVTGLVIWLRRPRRPRPARAVG